MTVKTHRKIIGSVIWVASVMTVWLVSTGITASASDFSAAEQAYSQLVTNDDVEAVIYTDEDLVNENYKFFGELFGMDDESNLYDGATLDAKANFCITKIGKSAYKVKMLDENKMTKRMLDPFIDMLITEAGVSDTDTPREKFYKISTYITETFEYDEETANAGGIPQDVISAYYGNRLITCKGYALLTYLMCNKSGIDCEYMCGSKHIYNLIRFDEEDPYYGIDLSSDIKGYINPLSMMIDAENLYHADRIADEESRALNELENGDKEFALAPIREYAHQSIYYIKNGELTNLIVYDALEILISILIVTYSFIAIKYVSKFRKSKVKSKQRKTQK